MLFESILKEERMLNNQKTYYSIREVCIITGLEPHVLRYWESEFQILRPKKNRAGNRAYKEKDIETIFTIKKLLYEDKFTIPGAKKKLLSLKNQTVIPTSRSQVDTKELLKETIQELKSILKIVENC